YRQVMQRRREMAGEAGLDPDVIEEMYRVLVDYFIRQEETLIRARGGTD
ncbi:MAG: isochorismate-pyruvate lyase, partial [Chloroflexi bacterium]